MENALELVKHFGFRLRSHGKLVAPRGFMTREVLNASAMLNDSRDCLFNMSGEDLDHLDMALHLMMIGDAHKSDLSNLTDDLPIPLYLSTVVDTEGANIIEQLCGAARELFEDRDSRQACVTVHSDNSKNPCIQNINYFIRHDKLHTTINIRSLDFVKKMKWDVAVWSAISTILANKLDVDSGPVTFNISSLHFYMKDEELFDNMTLITKHDTLPQNMCNYSLSDLANSSYDAYDLYMK